MSRQDYEFQYDRFIDVFPEFSKVSEDVVKIWSSVVQRLLVNSWISCDDDVYNTMVELGTAHLLYMRYDVTEELIPEDDGLTLRDMGDVVQVTSKTAGTGSLSESGSVIYTSDNSAFISTLSTTKYGLLLLTLIELYAPCGYVVK